jgi:hypothetical protein
VTQVRNSKTGEVIDVAADQVGDYVMRGFQVPKGTKVPVVVGGEVKELDIEHVQSGGLADMGGTLATGALVGEHRKQKEYGEGLAAVRGGAEAFGRGATLGLSDVAATGLGADAEGMRERKERLGGLGTALELAGNVAPLLATGGGGVFARGLAAAGAPVRAVTAAGAATEAGLARVLGQSAAAKMAATAGGTALEGAAFGAGVAASEAALNDSPLTGEALLAHMGTGAVVGGVAGGLFRGAGQMFGRSGADSAADRAAWRQAADADGVPVPAMAGGARAADDFATAGGPSAPRSSVFGEPAPAAKAVGAEAVDDLPGIRKFIKDVVGDQRDRIVKALDADSLDDLARDFAFSSGRPMAKHLKDARRFKGEDYAQKIGRDMLEELPKRAGKEYQYLSQEEIHTAARAAREDYGSRMGAEIKQADEAAQAAGRGDLLPNTDAIYARVSDEVLGKLESATAGRSAQRIAREIRADIDPYFKAREGRVTTFQDLKEFQTQFSALVENKLKSQSESGVAFKDVRRAMEREIEDRIEAASTELGLGGGYREAKSKFSSMKAVEKMTEDAISRDTKNRLFSLSDYVSGTAAMSGLAALGMGPGALIVGLALGGLNKIARERGSAIAAGALSRFARTQEIATVQQAVDKTSRAAVDAFFGGGAVKATTAAKTGGASLHDRFTDAMKRTKNATPDVVAQRTSDAVGDASGAAPMSAAAAVAASVRGYEFLRSKVPEVETLPSHYTSGTAERDRVPDTKKAKFIRYAEAVENPLGVVEQFGTGAVTREAAEALRVVYPALFGRMEQQIVETLTERDKPASYQQLTKLGVLLNRPLHPMHEPRFVGSVQAMYAAQGDKRGPQAPSSRTAPKANEKPTQAQRLASGE